LRLTPLLCLVVLFGTVARAEIIDRVLAILPGQIITQSDVQAAVDLGLVEPPAAGAGIAISLPAVIDRVLMLEEVHRVAPPEPSATDVEARLARIRQRFVSPAALSQVLAASGIDEAVLRIYAVDDLRLSAYLDERFSAISQPTDDEVRQAGEGARQRLMDERRRILVSEWTSELRRRADVTVLPGTP